MTKRHFIRLADYLRDIPKYCEVTGDSSELMERHVKIGDLVEHLSDYCHEQNPQFDRLRWFRYINGECGPNGGKR